MKRKSRVFFARLCIIASLAVVGASLALNYQRTQQTLQSLAIQSRIIMTGEAFKARVVPSMILGDKRASELVLCFEGLGSVCHRLSNQWMQLADGLFERVPYLTAKGEVCESGSFSLCSVHRTTEFRVQCSSATTCETVEARAVARSRFFPNLRRETVTNFVALETLQSARNKRRETEKLRPDLFTQKTRASAR